MESQGLRFVRFGLLLKVVAVRAGCDSGRHLEAWALALLTPCPRVPQVQSGLFR